MELKLEEVEVAVLRLAITRELNYCISYDTTNGDYVVRLAGLLKKLQNS